MKAKLFFWLILSVVVFAAPAPAQLDPANPPTGNLNQEELQKRIAQMLPHQPGLLKFKIIHTFNYDQWPTGLQDAGTDYQEAFKGYSLKTSNNIIFLLDKAGRSIFTFNPGTGQQSLAASDYTNKNIQFDDFCSLRDNRLVIADNSRNSLLFFKNNRLEKNVSFDGERIFFRYIDHIAADRLGNNLAVYDSGRDRSYVFDASGNLQWEIKGQTEPCFLGGALLKLDRHDRKLLVQRTSNISTTTLATYKCEPQNILLDAWAAGTFAGKLAIVTYEGRPDEDHPDYARLLLIKDQNIAVFKFIPNLDFRLNLSTPYGLLISRNGLELITAKIGANGIEVIAAPLK